MLDLSHLAASIAARNPDIEASPSKPCVTCIIHVCCLSQMILDPYGPLSVLIYSPLCTRCLALPEGFD